MPSLPRLMERSRSAWGVSPWGVHKPSAEDERFLIGNRRSGHLSGLALHIAEPAETDGKVPKRLGRFPVGVHKPPVEGERLVIDGSRRRQLTAFETKLAELAETDGKVAQCLGRLAVSVEQPTADDERFLKAFQCNRNIVICSRRLA